MAHRCVRCGKLYPSANEALLKGCNECGGHFFFFIRDEYVEKLKQHPLVLLPEEEKKQIEHDVRDIVGIADEETPVVLDLESIRVVGEGKFEIDLVKLFQEKRPVVYKLDEGKYIIDIASTLGKHEIGNKEGQ
jgi:hypothetical protein